MAFSSPRLLPCPKLPHHLYHLVHLQFGTSTLKQHFKRIMPWATDDWLLWLQSPVASLTSVPRSFCCKWLNTFTFNGILRDQAAFFAYTYLCKQRLAEGAILLCRKEYVEITVDCLKAFCCGKETLMLSCTNHMLFSLRRKNNQ